MGIRSCNILYDNANTFTQMIQISYSVHNAYSNAKLLELFLCQNIRIKGDGSSKDLIRLDLSPI